MPALMMMEETAMTTHSDTRRYLFTHFEGGGNTPPMLAIVRRLIARGHEVRVLGDDCNRNEVLDTGASFTPWKRAYNRPDKSVESDPLKDWEVSSPGDM